MSGARLYEIANRFQALESLETSEDIAPEVLKDTLDGIEAEFREKAIAVAAFLRNLESVSESIKASAKAQTVRAERLQKRADSLRAYLMFHMQATDITKIDSDLFTLRVRDNPAQVVVDDETAIPDEYWRQPDTPPKEIDKKAIGEAHKQGVDVPGTHSIKLQRVEIKS